MKPYRHNELIKRLVDSGELLVNAEIGEVRRASNPDKRASIKIDHSGYLFIRICQGGKRREVAIHRLVAYVLWGDAIFQQGIEVDHKDRDRSNCRGDNLQLVTQLENTRRRAVRHRWFTVEAEGKPIAYCKHIEDAERIVTAHRGQVRIA